MLKELLLSVQELLDHNIYHIDLGIKPECIKNTNVFLSLFPKVKPEIIDIDGKSAVYTEQKNSKYYEKSLKSYKNLMTYLLFDIDAEVLEDLDYEYERENLIKKNVPREYVDSILNYEEVIDIPELNTFLDFFDKPKVKSISKRK